MPLRMLDYPTNDETELERLFAAAVRAQSITGFQKVLQSEAASSLPSVSL
jgi:hypothetical protein